MTAPRAGRFLGVSSWPAMLTLVRHGESLGNVANERAYAAKAEDLDLAVNDPSVELSDLGVRQAEALGKRIGDLPIPNSRRWSSCRRTSARNRPRTTCSPPPDWNTCRESPTN